MQKKFKILLLILILIIVLGFVFLFCLKNSLADSEKILEVDFLDIGQGDSILIKTTNDQNILIDGGSDRTVIKRLSEELRWWDKTIDLMILTHPHDDHVGGLNDVISHYKVKKILYTGVVHNAPAYINWLNLIKDNNIPLIIISHLQTINLSEDCKLEIIYPFNDLSGKEVDNLNNSSIIAKLVYKNTSFLFTGDAEIEQEQELLKSNIDLSADVLKVCHHGANTSSPEDFLKAVNPKIAVIQVGKDNKFNHPSRRVIKRMERMGIEIFRNDLEGTVRLFSDGDSIYCTSPQT